VRDGVPGSGVKEAGAKGREGRSSAAGRRGRFIAFEGIDGSGKSSTLARVAASVAAEHPGLVATKEETESHLGEAVRRSIRERHDPLTTTFLFVADRVQHVREIERELAAGRHVLCDRFLHSTLAYQAVTLQGRVADPRGFLRGLHAGWCPRPDHVLLFRADPGRCVERTRVRGATTDYERVDFLRHVQDEYLALAAGDPTVRVFDAERDPETLAREATAIVRGWLR